MENEKNKISEVHLEAVAGGNGNESNDRGWEVHGCCPRRKQECYSYPCYYPGPDPVIYCGNCGSQLENVKSIPCKHRKTSIAYPSRSHGSLRKSRV